MKERPILFTGAMVRAILNGSKTQTRRVLKSNCQEIGERDDGTLWPWSEHPDSAADYWHPCPHGQPGDRLWVRETFQGPLFEEEDSWLYHEDPTSFQKPSYCQYAADGGGPPEFMTPDDELVCRWRRSIHMPRWASRILLEIVSVRVERLHAISEADARAEGITDGGCTNCGYPEPCGCVNPAPDARDAFCYLWGQINGPDAWAINPWCWCIEFKRVAK